jgi:hypothetical protein
MVFILIKATFFQTSWADHAESNYALALMANISLFSLVWLTHSASMVLLRLKPLFSCYITLHSIQYKQIVSYL